MIDLDTVDLGTLELTMSTTKGDMVFGFYHEEAPAHTRNITKLAMDGFYDGLAFHRIIKGFMIQGGCPNTRVGATGHPGTGGPGHYVSAEFSALPHQRGVLSMARSTDPNSAGSQFFVVHGEHVKSLDGEYSVFAYMKSGQDILDSIASVECEFGSGRERSSPTERVEIESMTVAVVAAPAAENSPAENSPAENSPAEDSLAGDSAAEGSAPANDGAESASEGGVS